MTFSKFDVVQSLSRFQLFATPWTVCSLPGFSVHGIFPGKNTGVGCRALLQGVIPTQGWNPRLLLWNVDSLPLSLSEMYNSVNYV